MADLDASLDLPELFDPVLDYLSAHLPDPVYSTLESLLTHTYTLLSSLLSLSLTLSNSLFDDREGSVRDRLEGWWDRMDAQQILPPLITLLAAYLALVSFYRTSRWMISAIFAFVKWGFILTTLGSAAGWYLANANVGGAEGGGGGGAMGQWGVFQAVGGLLSEFVQGQGNAATAGSGQPKTRSRTKKEKSKARPKAHESWDKHREWQYSETQESERQGDGFADVQNVIQGIMRAGEGGWWEAGKRFMEGESGAGQRQTRRERRERNTQSR
ncbi:hypothetical protein BC835DRAFT_1380705 [Cytidiella melzeri]|nr:hypothetical protein BC835DRAFT_1380705 [Cytidiella melzeri]